MTASNEINGINDNLLDKLIADVGSSADELLEILNKIDDEVSEAQKCVNCSSFVYFKEAYEGINPNYKIVNSNILSYGVDYAKVKEAYLARGLSIAKQVNSIDDKKIEKYEEGK